MSEIVMLLLGTVPIVMALGWRRIAVDVAQRLPLAYDLVIHGR